MLTSIFKALPTLVWILILTEAEQQVEPPQAIQPTAQVQLEELQAPDMARPAAPMQDLIRQTWPTRS
jgi:hypothetical protein